MPPLIDEKFDSRITTTGPSASIELKYIIRGSDDDVVITATLDAEAPGTYNGLVKQSLHIEPLGPLLWEGSARYGAVSQPPPPSTGDSVFSFDTGGGTQHITQSRQTINRYAPAGSTAPDFQGAIGVTDSTGNVEGVDITVPVYTFAETHYLSNAVVTPAYRGALFSLTGRVNDATFRGLAAGECLFLGASGSVRGTTDWEISFRFAGSPNVTGLTLGPISGIDKKGWEYLWVRYADFEDTTAFALVKRPTAVYIEKVYEPGNFASLGIGT